jgi:hypothetical protein
VYANLLTTYYDNLQTVNESFHKAGKTPILIKAADKNLTDDDLVQMVNAGLIPATVTTKERADLWSKVLDHIKPHPELVIAGGQQLAWVMRKNNPATEAVGRRIRRVACGGNLLRQQPASPLPAEHQVGQEFNLLGEMKKFRAMVVIFQKYATEHNFDYLMLAPQESLLDQSKRTLAARWGSCRWCPSMQQPLPSTFRTWGLLTETFMPVPRCCATLQIRTSAIPRSILQI